MILEFSKDQRVALGLLWGLETRTGIERIQQAMGLNYGFINDVRDSANKSLKSFALTDKEHNKAVSLAGVISQVVSNIIYVHKINDESYWLCIVQNGSVWSNYNINRATAGDFIGSKEQVETIIQAAVQDFTSNGMMSSMITFCSASATQDFPEYQVRSIESFIDEARKFKLKFKIEALISSSRATARKSIISFGVIFGLIVVAVGFYEKVQHDRLLRQQEEQRLAQMRELAAKISYFNNLTKTIQSSQGSFVIYRAMYDLEQLPLQSYGWRITKATFDQASPTNLKLNLSRTSFGTVNSFKLAFADFITQYNANLGKLDHSYDSGTKTVEIHSVSPVKFTVEPMTKQELVSQDNQRLNDFITFFQSHNIKVDLQGQQRSVYGVESTNFSLTGNNLWELRRYQFLFQRFKSLTIQSIEFSINNDDVNWTLKGTIYA